MVAKIEDGLAAEPVGERAEDEGPAMRPTRPAPNSERELGEASRPTAPAAPAR